MGSDIRGLAWLSRDIRLTYGVVGRVIRRWVWLVRKISYWVWLFRGIRCLVWLGSDIRRWMWLVR